MSTFDTISNKSLILIVVIKMDRPTIFFPQNLKFLRERAGISQEALAGTLGMTRSKLNALESGHTKAPQPEDFVKFSEYFRISLDSLLRVELCKLGEIRIRELQAGNDVYIKGGNLRVLAITVDKSNKENAEYVPVKAKAGYLAGYNDPAYIATLPRFSLPNLPQNGTYRIFPTTGDSMLPIPENSDIVARFITDWTAIKPGTLCIVIMRGSQDFVFKQVSFTEDNNFLLLSLNLFYTPYVVSVEEVLEIWEYQSFMSMELPESTGNMHEVKSMFREIKTQLSEIQNAD